MTEVISGSIGFILDVFLTLQNKSLATFSGLVSIFTYAYNVSFTNQTPQMYFSNYTALLKDPKYENLTELGLSGIAFDGVWAIAIGLDIASKKISSGNDSGCENVPGDLVPLEQFNYTNTKLGCILKQSFSEINFLGITVTC